MSAPDSWSHAFSPRKAVSTSRNNAAAGSHAYLPVIHIRRMASNPRRGWVFAGALKLPCALGRTGGLPAAAKREGDGTTPAGRYRAQTVFYRADAAKRPRSGLATRPIARHDGWCDAPGHGRYNRPVRLPFGASHERMWRDDHCYDLMIVIDHNSRPRKQRLGSAVFVHVARPGFAPTEGCVALQRDALQRLLERIGPRTRLVIH